MSAVILCECFARDGLQHEPGFVPTEGFPRKNMVGDRFMKHLLGTDAQVSEAIQDAIRNKKLQRVVPRWYYALQIPRVLTPWLKPKMPRLALKVVGSSAGSVTSHSALPFVALTA